MNISFSASHWLTFSRQVYVAIVVGQFSTTGVSSKIGVVTGTTTKIETHIIALARCYRVRNWQNPLKLVEMIWFDCRYYYIWLLCKLFSIFTFGVLGSAKDLTTASLPETSSCEVIPSFKEPSSSLSLRLLAFSCLPRQNGSSNLGNFFTRTVFSRFLPDLGVFLKRSRKNQFYVISLLDIVYMQNKYINWILLTLVVQVYGKQALGRVPRQVK